MKLLVYFCLTLAVFVVALAHRSTMMDGATDLIHESAPAATGAETDANLPISQPTLFVSFLTFIRRNFTPGVRPRRRRESRLAVSLVRQRGKRPLSSPLPAWGCHQPTHSPHHQPVSRTLQSKMRNPVRVVASHTPLLSPPIVFELKPNGQDSVPNWRYRAQPHRVARVSYYPIIWAASRTIKPAT